MVCKSLQTDDTNEGVFVVNSSYDVITIMLLKTPLRAEYISYYGRHDDRSCHGYVV